MLKELAPDLDNLHKSKVRLRHRDLEALSRVKFRLATRQQALAKHTEGKLLNAPHRTLVSWSDGSYAPGSAGGAACIISKPRNPSITPSTPIRQMLQLQHCASPYEAELHALGMTLHTIVKLNPKSSKIRHYTDAYSCLAQLQSLKTKPVLVHTGVRKVISSITKLCKRRHKLALRFIPSHANIGLSNDVDELAKLARNATDSCNPDPLLSTFKNRLTLHCTEQLQHYLDTSITTSSDPTKPSRTPFTRTRDNRTGRLVYQHRQTPHADPLLVRARTGHSMSRDHLHFIRIETSAECRHCLAATETIAHQVLHCTNLPRMQTILRARTKYIFRMLDESDFYELIWAADTKPAVKLLRAAKRAGAYI